MRQPMPKSAAPTIRARAKRSIHVVLDHRFEVLGIAFDGQDDGSFLDAVGRGGDGGDDLPALRQSEAQGKGAVGAQVDRLALDGDPGVGVGGSKDDQFGVELEPELTALARPGKQVVRAKAGDGGRSERSAKRSSNSSLSSRLLAEGS